MARPLFWAGFAGIVAPLAYRLLSERPTRSERALLLVFFGLVAYAVKVLHDPSRFSMADEFLHLSATQHVVTNHDLGAHLSLGGAGVAGGYPGLHILTAAISEVSGLGLFASGTIAVAVARVIMMLALFLLFERLTDSLRLASLAALLYAGNANFLFWSAQFAYQSLALPLMTLALWLLAERARRPLSERRTLTVFCGLIALATVPTHHLTSYALTACLWVLTLCSLRRPWRAYRATGLALMMTGAASFWFVAKAQGTGGYLGFVFHKTAGAVIDAAGGGTRAPFRGGSGAGTPLLEQGLGLSAALLALLGLAWTLQRLRRPPPALRLTPLTLLVVIAGASFPALFLMKLLPGAWETANRAQEFLFVGVAPLLAFAAVAAATSGRPAHRRARAVAAAAGLTVVVCGGVVQGWPSALRLPAPGAVDVDGIVLYPQNAEFSRWATETLPPASTFAADEVTGRELAVDGAHFAFIGSFPGVPQLLASGSFPAWQRDFVTDNSIDYVVLDRRRLSNDPLAGFFFQRPSHQDGYLGYYQPAVRAKLSAIPGVTPIYDSGDIVVYDVRPVAGLRRGSPACSAVPPAQRRSGVTCATRHAVIVTADADADAGADTALPGLTVSLNRFFPLRAGLTSMSVTVANTSSQRYAPPVGEGGLTLRVAGRSYRPVGVGPAVTLATGARTTWRFDFRLPSRARRAIRGFGAQVALPLPDQVTTHPRQLRGVVSFHALGRGPS